MDLPLDVLTTELPQAAVAPTAEDSAAAILAGAMRLLGANRGRLYFVDLPTGTLSAYAQVGRTDRGPQIRLDSRSAPEDCPKPIERVLRTVRTLHIPDTSQEPSSYRSSKAASRLLIPVVRLNTCIGILDLDCAKVGAFTLTPETGAALDALCSMLIRIYERRFTLQLLSESQQPIDFRRAEHEFLEDLILLLALSSQMELLALHQVQPDGGLRCIGLWGFGPNPSYDMWDLRMSDYPIYGEALQKGQAVAVPKASVSLSPDSRDRFFRAIGSFVVAPVPTGAAWSHVLTFASSAAFEYSSMELRGFQSLANGTGVSIANFHNFHDAGVDLSRFNAVATSIVALDVAQAARHEVHATVDNCVSRILLFEQELSRDLASKRLANTAEFFDLLERDLLSVNKAMDKIKSASRPPDRAFQIQPLRPIWEEARSQIIGRLNQLNIERVQYEGPDVDVNVAKDWFRQIFLNLLLNSADAFAEQRGHQRNRRIGLQVERPAERANTITLTYTDNAGGINPSQLKSIDEPEVPLPTVERAVFMPNVTSKSSGSGWGLTLVERIITEHKGSINLISYRGGVTFRIELPPALEPAKPSRL